VVDGVRYGKRLPKDQWLELKAKIDAYNEKNDAKVLDEIMSVMAKVKTEKKKEVEAKLVEAKKEEETLKEEIKQEEVKKEEVNAYVQELSDIAKSADKVASGEFNPEDLSALEALVAKYKKVEEKKAPAAKVGSSRSGEY
jgi:hypothetical protein